MNWQGSDAAGDRQPARAKRARRRLAPTLSGLVLLATLSLVRAAVVINEIHHSPDVKTEPVEFIELYNAGTDLVDLSGWAFTEGVSFTFPAGTQLAAGSYLVVAQNPAALRAKFGVNSLGPWEGRLDGHGEKLTLRNAAGQVEDEVDYKLGFPWPTVGEPPGYSIELVNPALDNNLGGSWRASSSTGTVPGSLLLVQSGQQWRYFRGWGEASTPTNAWRNLDFDDSAWELGAAPIGYGEDFLSTKLADMRYNYTTVYFRKAFEVANPAEVGSLQLEALYDDGFIVWINTTNVLSQNVPGVELPAGATANTARESYNFETFNLPPPARYLRPGLNVIAVQGLNSSLTESSDFFMDFRLTAKTGAAGQGPTPGAPNSVFSPNLPPQIRQVEHHPQQPVAGQTVTVTAKITDPDGVASVSLLYQVVAPGRYIELSDPAYQTNWVAVSMNDNGQAGDEVAGDDVFTAELPGAIQEHRRLVRYRLRAADTTGQVITVPYADDPQPNFAYFVYDGVPAWRGAIQPGSADPVRGQVTLYPTNLMRSLPVYHLLTTSNSLMHAQFIDQYGGDLYKWAGTLVYDGQVYDHIHYRARGGVWRYSMGKNMWKFDFNRGHDFEPHDNYGRKYKPAWTKLNLGACIQQGDYQHRGEQGMFESVGFRLFNLAGVAASQTHFVHFRVIDEAEEANPTNQYRGDFWGLYLAVEQDDTRFLEGHDLPDGNFYKMEGGAGELNNQGATAVTDKSDLNKFLNTFRNTTPPDSWWRTNFNLAQYYSYQAIVQGIHHYDICYGKNYFYYLNPETGVWSVHPWDLDLTWADNMYDSGCGGIDEFKNRVLNRAAFKLEYQNRVREIRDLLFNTNQTWQLIDEYAAFIYSPGVPSFVGADRAMWDYNPIMVSAYVLPSKAGQGRFYQVVPTKDFPGMLLKMKNYVVSRGTLLDNSAKDAAIPAQPTLTAVGPTNFPVNRLVFRAAPYSGSAPFAAMKWRLAEVSDPNNPNFDPGQPRRYEITADWESPELTEFNAEMSVPPGVAKVGHSYRVRVRMKDNTGRWSRWSEPIQFVAGEPDNAAALVDSLRLSELMYDPPGGGEFEFIELHNTSPALTLELGGVKFTAGIDYTFPPGAALPPDGYILVVRASAADNFAAFRNHYGLEPGLLIAGPYAQSLANEGETVTLKTAANGAVIFSFTYGDGRGWPIAAAGAGHSLVPLESAAPGQPAGALDYGGNWRASALIGGSPGRPDPEPAPTVVLNEIMAHTDYADPLHPEYDSNDWIELYNPTASAVTLTSWYLSDDAANLKKWAIPPVTIRAGNWLSFDEVTGFHQPITNGFGLNKAGEELFLACLPGTAQDRVVDAVKFKGQAPDVSLGRYPDGAPQWRALMPTRDRANRLAPVGLVISEFMYHPPDLGPNQLDNTSDEFVELFNPTPSAVNLFDTNGVWRLDGAVEFEFPTNTALAPGACLLVVSFDPADGSALAAFQSRYAITNLDVPILGPYQDKLANSSERLALERPQLPDQPGDPYSYVIVDEVIYGDQAPWPPAADGAGSSLHRRSLVASGNDPANWLAAAPTPGACQADSGTTDADGDGLPDAWEQAHGLNPFDATGNDGPAGDPDGDGLSNLQEYLAGTDPTAITLKFAAATLSLDGLCLEFNRVAGKTVSVEYRDSLTAGGWLVLTNLTSQPGAQTIQVTDPSAPSHGARFYRLTCLSP